MTCNVKTRQKIFEKWRHIYSDTHFLIYNAGLLEELPEPVDAAGTSTSRRSTPGIVKHFQEGFSKSNWGERRGR